MDALKIRETLSECESVFEQKKYQSLALIGPRTTRSRFINGYQKDNVGVVVLQWTDIPDPDGIKYWVLHVLKTSFWLPLIRDIQIEMIWNDKPVGHLRQMYTSYINDILAKYYYVF